MTQNMFSKKQVDFRVKNTKRKITKEVAQQVIDRDKLCIICLNESIEEIHHCFYWNEAQYDEWRNNADRLVWLGKNCHFALHHQWWNNYREQCIQYLESSKSY